MPFSIAFQVHAPDPIGWLVGVGGWPCSCWACTGTSPARPPWGGSRAALHVRRNPSSPLQRIAFPFPRLPFFYAEAASYIFIRIRSSYAAHAPQEARQPTTRWGAPSPRACCATRHPEAHLPGHRRGGETILADLPATVRSETAFALFRELARREHRPTSSRATTRARCSLTLMSRLRLKLYSTYPNQGRVRGARGDGPRQEVPPARGARDRGGGGARRGEALRGGRRGGGAGSSSSPAHSRKIKRHIEAMLRDSLAENMRSRCPRRACAGTRKSQTSESSGKRGSLVLGLPAGGRPAEVRTSGGLGSPRVGLPGAGERAGGARPCLARGRRSWTTGRC